MRHRRGFKTWKNDLPARYRLKHCNTKFNLTKERHMSNAKIFARHVLAFIVSHVVAVACLVAAVSAFFMDLRGMHWFNLLLITTFLAGFISIPMLIANLARFNILVATLVVAIGDASALHHLISHEPGLQDMPTSAAVYFWLFLFALAIVTAAASSYSYKRIAAVTA